MIEKKKGLSPIIATVLLMTMALVLGVIIYAWASSFIGDVLTKFDRPVENACNDIDFDAEIRDVPDPDGGEGSVNVFLVNRGNVALYGVEVRLKNSEEGSVSTVGVSRGKTIPGGKDGTVKLEGVVPSQFDDVGGENGVLILPIILGEGESYTKPYTCGENSGKIKYETY